MAEKYIISPIEHLLSLDKPSLHMFPMAADWPSRNLTINQKRLKKRWGYLEDRDLGANVQGVWIYQEKDASNRHTMYLTDTDLCEKKTSTNETWCYLTEMITYTSKIESISGTTITLVSGEEPDAVDGIADGDYFMLDDDYQANKEPTGHDNSGAWTSIASVSDVTPSITTDTTYPGTTGSGSGWPKTGYVRKVYTTPTNGRWQVAVVDDTFCFTNGNVDAQYWAGSNYAAALDATYATNAKYCIEYGNRLCLANLKVAGAFAPWTFRSSANGDPTKWSTEDTTAVDYDFIETDDVISGLGKVGASIVIYKTESLIIGHKTARATDPFAFPTQKRGIGCIAPNSIVEVKGTNMFLGRDDFYIIEGDHPEPIGERIRYKFKEIVGNTEQENVWGFSNTLENEVVWIANTLEGKFAFVFNYKDMEWGAYWYGDDISGAGRGAV